MNDLTKKKCVPCIKGGSPLKGEALSPFYTQLDTGWKVINEQYLEKEYLFKESKQALAFINIIGKIAEKENHYPDIYLSLGKLKLKIWTHKINGISESDFILAAKIEAEFISHQG